MHVADSIELHTYMAYVCMHAAHGILLMRALEPFIDWFYGTIQTTGTNLWPEYVLRRRWTGEH